VELQNDGGETTACLGEEVEASLEVLGLCGFVALVNGVVPDLPVRVVSILILQSVCICECIRTIESLTAVHWGAPRSKAC
jgi:hypothetical protein